MWSLSNLVRGKPHVAFEKVQQVVPMLVRLLAIDDAEVRQDACWALSYLGDCGNKVVGPRSLRSLPRARRTPLVQLLAPSRPITLATRASPQVIDALALAGAAPGMVALLGCGEMRVITPAMRALANLLTGSDDATQTVLNAGFLAALPPLFQTPKMQLRKEVCWAVSNITAGTAAQLDEVMRTNLLGLVIDRLDKDEFEVKKEAMWVLANVMHGYKNEPSLHAANRVRTLVQLGCLKPMSDLLDKNDPAVQSLVLEACANLLAAGEELGRSKGENEFVKAFDEAEGIDKLEALQEHKNANIYNKAVEILETYFGEDEARRRRRRPNRGSPADLTAVSHATCDSRGRMRMRTSPRTSPAAPFPLARPPASRLLPANQRSPSDPSVALQRKALQREAHTLSSRRRVWVSEMMEDGPGCGLGCMELCRVLRHVV